MYSINYIKSQVGPGHDVKQVEPSKDFSRVQESRPMHIGKEWTHHIRPEMLE